MKPPPAVPLARSGRWLALRGSLSARLVVLMVLFMTLAGLLMQLPAVARYRMACLEDSIARGFDIALALRGGRGSQAMPATTTPEYMLEEVLLHHSQIVGVEVGPMPGPQVWMLGSIPDRVDATVVVAEQSIPWLLLDTLQTLLGGADRIVRVEGMQGNKVPVAVYVDEAVLYRDVYSYTLWIVLYSLIIALALAALLYLCLQWLVVRSIRSITLNLKRFRENPEQTEQALPSGVRDDEIGYIEAELSRMQRELRAALAQQTRLAALGGAVSKLNHDFKSILSTVSIASGRLAKVDDPTVRRIAPLLVGSVERAIGLCTQAQDLARGDQVTLNRERFMLRVLAEEVWEALEPRGGGRVGWHNQVDPTLKLDADRERLYRVLLNLGQNAIQAGATVLRLNAVCKDDACVFDVHDNGPGIPEAQQRQLFQPFVGSTRAEGTGLGLVIARDLIRAHGGELVLRNTEGQGTCFRIRLPQPPGTAA